MAASKADRIRPYQFKKGQIANPSGRPKVPAHLLAIKALTADEINRTIAKYGRMTYAELEHALHDPKTITVDRAVISIYSRAVKDGDTSALSFLLDRSIGKAPMFLSDEEEDEKLKLAKLPWQELLLLVKNAIPEINLPIESNKEDRAIIDVAIERD